MTEGITIRTSCNCPPIPTRAYDWQAWRDGNEEYGPFGYGATEEAAIAALIEQEDEW